MCHTHVIVDCVIFKLSIILMTWDIQTQLSFEISFYLRMNTEDAEDVYKGLSIIICFSCFIGRILTSQSNISFI